MAEDHELYTIREIDETKIIRKVRARLGENVSQVPVKVIIKNVEKDVNSPAQETGSNQQSTTDNVQAKIRPVNGAETKEPVSNEENKDENSKGQDSAQQGQVVQDQIKVKPQREDMLHAAPPEEEDLNQKITGWNRDYGPVTITQICLYILSGLSFTLAVPMMVIGSINYANCPGGWFVPIYLIVGGCFGLALSSFMTGDIVLRYPTRLSRFTYSLFWISVIWHCIGLIMTIRLRSIQFHDWTIANYCDYLVYHFALYLSSGLIVAFIIIICILIFICVCHSSY